MNLPCDSEHFRAERTTVRSGADALGASGGAEDNEDIFSRINFGLS